MKRHKGEMKNYNTQEIIKKLKEIPAKKEEKEKEKKPVEKQTSLFT